MGQSFERSHTCALTRRGTVAAHGYAVAAAVVLLATLFGCSDDSGPSGPDADREAPEAVSDLTVSASAFLATLRWTAPSDPPSGTPVSRYEARLFAGDPKTARWDAGAVLPEPPDPSDPGAPESLRVAGLTVGETFWFALRSFDAAGNESSTSNAVFVETICPPHSGDCALELTRPRAGEAWCEGRAETLEWLPSDCCGDSVRIELQVRGVRCDLTASMRNTGTFLWENIGTCGLEASPDEPVTLIVTEIDTRASDKVEIFLEPDECRIEVLAPSGDDVLQVNAEHRIEWSRSTCCPDSVDLFLCRETDCVPVAESVPNDGAFAWSVPGSVEGGGGYVVQVRDASGALGESGRFTVDDACTLEVTEPRDDAVFDRGRTVRVRWEAAPPCHPVTVELLCGADVCEVLAEDEPNDGAFDWIAAAPAGSEARYRFRVRDPITGVASESGTFQVDTACTLQITAPVDGDELQQDQLFQIRWQPDPPCHPVTLELLRDGEIIETLGQNQPNDGAFPWRVPQPTPLEESYQIRVRDPISGAESVSGVFRVLRTTIRHRPDGTGDYPDLRAALEARPGAVHVFENGVYSGPGWTDVSGTFRELRSASGDPGLCVFDGEGLRRGPTLQVALGMDAVVSGVTFRNFRAEGEGGAAALTLHSTPQHSSSHRLLVRDCVFAHNVRYGSGAGLSVTGRFELSGCVFAYNRATEAGAAFYVPPGEPVDYAPIYRCTFYRNEAPLGSALHAEGVYADIQNSIITRERGEGPAVHIGIMDVGCTDAWGNEGGDWVGSLTGKGPDRDASNLSENPRFCNTGDLRFEISAHSPCAPGNHCGYIIGAGDLGCGQE